MNASSIRVGLVGLGAMGSGMAGSLRKAGYDLHVYDVRHDVAQALASLSDANACATS